MIEPDTIGLVTALEMDEKSEFSWAIAKQLVDGLLFEATGKYLSDIESLVLQGAWNGKSYGVIAEELGYTIEYINSDVGFTLWNKLSKAVDEKVTKRNFRGALERKWQISSQYPAQSATSGLESQTPSPEHSASPYVDRPPTEARCFEALMQPGALIRIKAPQKMGKTWLLDRILTFAQAQDYLIVPINVLRIEASILQDLGRFLKSFCVQVTRKLQLENKIDQYWDESLGVNTSCTEYFEEYILQNCDRPLVLALDNVDRLFSDEEVASNFFSLLRAWYEDARILEDWQKLRLIISHSTNVYPTLNVNCSPFNVGLAVELAEFTQEQIVDLAQTQGLGEKLPRSSDSLSQLIQMVGGHPYLIQKCFDCLQTQPEADVKTLLQSAPTEAGPYAPHLRALYAHLQDNPELSAAMKLIVQATEPIRVKPEEGFMLHSLGLVHLRGNEVEVRCQLYRQYLSDRLADF